MKVNILNLDHQVIEDLELQDNIFGIEPRIDIIKTVVDWQRLKAMSGNHKTKTVSEISGTTKKPFKQKGTGNARQGSLRSVQMRGGAVSHGPVVRSHAVKLPKKVRALGLRCALSLKMQQNKLLVFESFNLDNSKTNTLLKFAQGFLDKGCFVVDGSELNQNLKLAAQNLHKLNVVPQIGINVYDIIKNDYLLLSKEAINYLQERLA